MPVELCRLTAIVPVKSPGTDAVWDELVWQTPAVPCAVLDTRYMKIYEQLESVRGKDDRTYWGGGGTVGSCQPRLIVQMPESQSDGG